MTIEFKLSEESILNLSKDYFENGEKNEDNTKGFKSLLNKYQSLIGDYHKQSQESKESIRILIERAEKLNEENKRLKNENEYLKKRINYMANRMDSMECIAGETRCMRTCNRKYFENEKYDYSKPYPNADYK